MVLAMTRRPDPSLALLALLDALEAELLAAPAAEVRDALRETGRARDGACREVRSVLDHAAAANEDVPVAVAPCGMRDLLGLHRH